jgi:hypothetical protein
MEGEYRGDFALLVAGRGALWQFVPRGILSSSYIIIRKRNFAKTDCRAAVSRNHSANRLILRYFPALG